MSPSQVVPVVPPTTLIRAQIRGLQEGKTDAGSNFCRLFSPLLRRAVRNRMGTLLRLAFEEEDLLQDVFLRLLRAFDDGKFPAVRSRYEFVKWLTMVARNELADRMRRLTSQKNGGRRVRRAADLDSSSVFEHESARVDDPAAHAQLRELQSIRERAEARLGERDRLVLHLREHWQLAYDRIVEVMGLASQENARSIFFRAFHRRGRAVRELGGRS